MSALPPPDIRKWPAARALAWVAGGLGLIRRQPLRLLLISLVFQLLLSFSQATALGLLAMLCLPVFSAGLLQAFFLVECGERPGPAVLLKPFTDKKSAGRLLLLGALVLVLSLLAVSLALAGQVLGIDPGLIDRIEKGDLDALQLLDPQVIETAVLAMAVGAAVSGMVTYFAVPLIWFSKQGVGPALVTGLKALGRNWRPLLVIGASIGLLSVPLALLLGAFYLSAVSGGGASALLAGLLLLSGPLLQLFIFATQYLAFRDVLGFSQGVAEQAGKPPGQLLA